MRLPLDEEEKVDIQMSPLIDCVFLLLIFFLVTTMMKKWEMQIPLSLPEMTSSLSTTRSGENTVIIAVDEDKQVYEVVHHDAYTGENDYLPIGDLDTYLNGLREQVRKVRSKLTGFLSRRNTASHRCIHPRLRALPLSRLRNLRRGTKKQEGPGTAPPAKNHKGYDFLRRHYPHQVKGSKLAILPLSPLHELPCV